MNLGFFNFIHVGWDDQALSWIVYQDVISNKSIVHLTLFHFQPDAWSDVEFWKALLRFAPIMLWATNAPPTLLSFYSTGGFYKLYLLIVKIRNASVKKPSVPSCIICQYGGHLVCIDWSSLGPLLDNVVPPWPIMATVTWTQHNDPPT